MIYVPQYHTEAEQLLRSLPNFDVYEQLLRSVGDVSQRYLAHYDTESRFNVEGFRQLGHIGFLSMCKPEKYGGFGAPFPFFIAGLEILARYEPGSTMGYSIGDTATEVIARDLVGEKERYYVDIIHGRSVAAFALTEDGSGSDARNSVRTRYKRCGDGFELDGEKHLITNGLSADIAVVVARDTDSPERLSAFLAETGRAGLKRELMKGKNNMRTSETTSLIFEGYRIPAWSLIGREGGGFDYAISALNSGRITIAGISNGISRSAIDKTMKYAEDRTAFGQKLIDIPAYRSRINAMEAALGHSRRITYYAALMKDRVSDNKKLAGPAAVTKVVASETAGVIAHEAIEMCGAESVVNNGLNSLRNDADVCRIGEGANGMLASRVIPHLTDREWKKYLKMQEILNNRIRPRLY